MHGKQISAHYFEQISANELSMTSEKTDALKQAGNQFQSIHWFWRLVLKLLKTGTNLLLQHEKMYN